MGLLNALIDIASAPVRVVDAEQGYTGLTTLGCEEQEE